MSEDCPDAVDQAEAATKIAQKALQRVADLEDEHDRLRYRIAELEHHAEATGGEEYDELERSEKIAKVQRELVDRAAARTGSRAEMDYNDIRWSVFNGKPSDGHAHDLMRAAASKDGFERRRRDGENDVVAVNLSNVTDETLLDLAELGGDFSWHEKNLGGIAGQ